MYIQRENQLRMNDEDFYGLNSLILRDSFKRRIEIYKRHGTNTKPVVSFIRVAATALVKVLAVNALYER